MKQLQMDLKVLIKEIHDEFGLHSLVVSDQNPSLERRLTVWSQAQILLVSTLKDGLCLPPLEFATVKKLMGDLHNSSMILSEFSGCSSAFNGFHEFNPFNQQDFCKALDTCLNLSRKKKEILMSKAYKYCCQFKFNGWVDHFLKELKDSYNPSKHLEARYVYLGLSTVDCLKANQQVSKSPHTKLPQLLNLTNFNTDFLHSNRSLIIINHEALPCKQYGKYHMQPQDQTIEYLKELTQDSRNIVVVISNEEKETVQQAFRKMPNIWLAAESGYWYKTDKSDWKRFFEQDSKEWLKTLRKIFDQYSENIEGTVVEERESSISWNYRNAAEEHGLKFSKELYNQVFNLIGQANQPANARRTTSSWNSSSSDDEETVLQNVPLQVNHGNGFIEVVPMQLKKEKLIEAILTAVKSRSDRKIDFLVFIGSDQRDERYFEYFKQITQADALKNSEFFSTELASRLCIIGRRPSNADYYMDSENQVAYLIQKLGFTNNSRKKNRSYSNLLVINKPQSSLESLTGEVSFPYPDPYRMTTTRDFATSGNNLITTRVKSPKTS